MLEHVGPVDEAALKEATATLTSEAAADDAARAAEEGGAAPPDVPAAAPVAAPSGQEPSTAPAPAAAPEEPAAAAAVSELMARLADADRERRELHQQLKQFRTSSEGRYTLAELKEMFAQQPTHRQRLAQELGIGIDEVLGTIADAPPERGSMRADELAALKRELQETRQTQEERFERLETTRREEFALSLVTHPQLADRWEMVRAEANDAIPLVVNVMKELEKNEHRRAGYEEALDLVEDWLVKREQAITERNRKLKKLGALYGAAAAPPPAAPGSLTPDVSGAGSTPAPRPKTDAEVMAEARAILLAESNREE